MKLFFTFKTGFPAYEQLHEVLFIILYAKYIEDILPVMMICYPNQYIGEAKRLHWSRNHDSVLRNIGKRRIMIT